MKLIEYGSKRYTYQLITATHSMMNEMINGMQAVEESVKSRILETKINAEEDCVFAIQGCAVTCIRCTILKAEEIITDDKGVLVLHADKLYKYFYKRHEIFLVVGSTDGLKSELVKDIKVTCKKAGFDEKQTIAI